MFAPGIIQYPTVTYILDVITGAIAGWSLRKISSTATNAIRVRRSSDNAEQNIGFSGVNLDVASLLSFCSGTNGFVTIIYDQSGSGNNLIQPTSSLQPQIVTGGSLTTTDGANGRAAIQFTNSGDQYMYTPTGFLASATALSFIATWNIDTSASSNGGVFGNSGGDGITIISNDGGVNKLRLNTTDRIASPNQMFTDDTHFITEIYGDGSGISGWQNNAATTFSNSSALPTLASGIEYWVARYSSSSNDTTMKFQELIIYNSNKVASRSTIYSDNNTYYG